MGNRLLRKKAAEAIKKAGIPSKLYRGKGQKHSANASTLQAIIKQLSYRPGDVVHDCDGANHVVAKQVRWQRVYNEPFWFGYDIRDNVTRGVRGYRIVIDDQIEFEGGRLSCGCPGGVMEPIPRDTIERQLLSWIGSHDDSWQAKYEWYRKVAETLRTGGHIHDERGILLPEWDHSKFNWDLG